MKRFLKHFFYGIFYLAILAGIGYLFYGAVLRPAPSCFDGIQNQGEEGVDCGGPCAKICLPPDIRPLASVGQVKILPLLSGRADALFIAQNPNPDYAIKDLTYNLKIYDANGSVLKIVTGNSFLYGGEIKYIAAPNLNLGTTAAARADFEITNPVWIKAENFRKAELIIQSPNAAISGANIQVNGKIFNRDSVAFPLVKVVAVLSDETGNQSGVSETQIEDLLPGETRSFTIFHPNLPGINPDGTQVFVYAARP